MVRTWPPVKPSARSSPISRVRWMTPSDMVLTKPTAAIADETTTTQIMTAETLRRMSSVWAAWVAVRSHESAAVRSAAKPAANVVTSVTPMTSPIVERVVRPGSRTALRAATLLGGSRAEQPAGRRDQAGYHEPGADEDAGAGEHRAQCRQQEAEGGPGLAQRGRNGEHEGAGCR